MVASGPYPLKPDLTTLERKGHEARKASIQPVFFATFARFAFGVVFRCG
jgi:hypothetical protein